MGDAQHDTRFVEQLYSSYSMGWGWTLALNDDLTGGMITNPAAVTHPIFTTASEWSEGFKSCSTTTEYLWVFSLNHIVDVDKAAPELAVEILDSFYDYLGRYSDTVRRALPGSWDHCTSMRLKALVALIGSSNPTTRERAVTYLDSELHTEDLWKLIDTNNHGLMLAESLLYAGIVEQSLDPGGSEGQEIIDRGTSAVNEIISSVFGEDFHCNENSPFYHHFYIHRLTQMREHFDAAPGVEKLIELLDDTVAKATVTMRNILFQDGSVPGMGDSTPMATTYGSDLGTFWSERTGFWVWKSERLYASLKCGYETLIHKHADDTSVVIRYDGEDFITDSGTANYDYSDPRILMLRTQRAHSGVYFEKFDDLHPAHYYRGENKAHPALYSMGENTARGGYTINGFYTASRILNVQDENHFIIEDWAASAPGDTFIHRFIVPAGVKVEQGRTHLLLRGGRNQLRIGFSTVVDIAISVAQKAAPHKGWLSTKANEVEPAQCVEVRIANRSINSLRMDCRFSPVA